MFEGPSRTHDMLLDWLENSSFGQESTLNASSRTMASARSNSRISSFEQEGPVRCSTRFDSQPFNLTNFETTLSLGLLDVFIKNIVVQTTVYGVCVGATALLMIVLLVQ